MTKALKFIAVTFVIILCVAIIGFVFAVPTLERKAGQAIMQQLREKLDAKVELRLLRISSLWPLGLRIQNLKISPHSGNYRAEVDRVFVRLYYLPPARLEVEIQKPLLEWIGEPSSATQESAVAQPSTPVSGPFPIPASVGAFLAGIGAEVTISGGVVSWRKDEDTRVRLEQVEIAVKKMKLLNESEPVTLKMTSNLNYATPWLGGDISLAAQSSDLKVSPDEVFSKNTEIKLGGMVLHVDGISKFKASTHDWNVKAAADNLERLPKPPDSWPAQNWKGKIDLSSSVHMTKTEMKAEGSMLFDRVSADLKWESPSLHMKGPFKVDTRGHFEYSNSEYTLKDMALNIDFSAAEVEYYNETTVFLRKPADVPLTLDYQGDVVNNAFDLHSLKLQLFNLKAEAQGHMPFKGFGEVHFQTSPTSLTGWKNSCRPWPTCRCRGTWKRRDP